MVLVDQSLQGLQETGAVGIREVEGEGVGAVVDRMALGDGFGAVLRKGRRAGLVEIQGPGQFIDVDVLEDVAVPLVRDGDGICRRVEE